MSQMYIPVGGQGNGPILSNILYQLGSPNEGTEVTMYYSQWKYKFDLEWLYVDTSINFYIQPNADVTALLDFITPYQIAGYITETEVNTIETFINSNKGNVVKLTDILPAFYIANSRPVSDFIDPSLTP